MDRGAWQAIVTGIADSQTQLSANIYTHIYMCVFVCIVHFFFLWREGIFHNIISNTDKIAVCYEPLYYYAVRQGSTMNTGKFTEKNLLLFPLLEKRMAFFESKGWHSLTYLTMRNYLVHCLVIYNRIDSSTENGARYKKSLMETFKSMLKRMSKHSVKSKKFVLQMKYYSIFPEKFANIDRNTFLFGEK